MQAYEEVAEFIARRGPRDVADFRPSAESRERAVALLERETLDRDEMALLNRGEPLPPRAAPPPPLPPPPKTGASPAAVRTPMLGAPPAEPAGA